MNSEVVIATVAWIASLQVKSKTSVLLYQIIQLNLEGLT